MKKIIQKNLLVGLYDVVNRQYIVLTIANTVPACIRQYMGYVINTRALSDVEIRELGYLDDDDNIILFKKYVVHAWSEYKFAESKAEYLAPLGLSPDQVSQLFSDDKDDSSESSK